MVPVLYITDVDGTLAQAGHELREDTARLMRKITDAGIPVTLATGRYVSKTLDVADQAGVTLPVIALNGAILFHPRQQRAIKTWPLPWSSALEIVRRVEETGANVRVIHHRPWEQRCVLYTSAPTPHGASITRRNALGFLYDQQLVFPSVANMLSDSPENGELLYIGTSGQQQLVEQAAQAAHGVSGTHVFVHQSPHQPEKWFLDIVSQTSGKGVAALWLKNNLHAQTLAVFGDHENDVPLLQAGDIACVVPTAPPKVRSLAHTILPQDINSVPHYIIAREGL